MDNGNIFSVAVTACNIRASLLGQSYLQQQLCLAFVEGFGGGVNSLALYQKFNLNPLLNSTEGLAGGSLYDTYENNIYDFLNSLYPTVPENQLKILAMVVNSLMLGYSIYQTIDDYAMSQLIGNVIWNTAQIVNGNQIFQMFSEDGIGYIIQPFTEEVVANLLTYNYGAVFQAINTSPKNTEVQLVNYNWYDTSSLFANPNLQVMQDVENQYYFFSGELNYQGNLEVLPDCVTQTIGVNTTSGLILTPYIVNLPCQQPNQLVAPVNNIIFNRTFNDGPYSSGDFTPAIQTAYMNFDYVELQPADYSSNLEVLYSFVTGNTGQFIPLGQNPVYRDGEGEYSIPQEYTKIPAPYSCAGSYGVMHIGNNASRYLGVYSGSGDCTGYYFAAATGFKFAALQLDQSAWRNNFTYIQTNPETDNSRFMTRALNTNPLTYMADNTGDGLQTWAYFGPPQFTGTSRLPTIAFYQDFQSPTFLKKGRIAFFPAIGISYGAGGSDADRTYSISSTPLDIAVQTGNYSLVGDTPFIMPFSATITSSFGNTGDSVIREFFGMGDSLTSYDSITAYAEQNAGYFYTGYVVSIGGQLFDILSLTGDAGFDILGSPVSGITFTNGYTNGTNVYGQSRFLAQDPTGGLVTYYYLDNTILPTQYQVQENDWTGQFAPLPTGFESDPTISRTTGIQQVENYLPRYARGPYATNLKTFLYPNAAAAAAQYDAQQNGFPSITFTLNIREEAVKEMYGQFIIDRNGHMNSIPVFKNVIRTTADGVDLDVTFPTMYNLFINTNPAFEYTLDFNNWLIGGDFSYTNGQVGMVDTNWSPIVYNPVGYYYDYQIVPSGKNNFNYSDTATFNQGILLTGNGPLTYTLITGTGQGDYFHYYRERPFANALYHMYATDTRTGQLTYVLPIFDISNGTLNVNATIQQAFAAMFGVNRPQGGPEDGYGGVPLNGSDAYFMNGSSTVMTTGQDPLYLDYIGGRSGSPLAIIEGGYHPQGIIGDLWNSFTYDAFGMTKTVCYGVEGIPGIFCNYPCNLQERFPSQDSKVVLLNSTPSQTEVFTRGLAFSPFAFPFQFNPFGTTVTLNYQIGSGAMESTTLYTSGDFASFDLSELLPYVYQTGTGQWYSPTGVTIGPFDRDVELGVTAGNAITSISGDLWWNNNLIALAQINNATYCNQFYLQMLTQASTGIVPGDNSGGGTRDPNFTIFGLLPSGQTANFNLSGYYPGVLGLEEGSVVAIRPRKVYGASTYSNQIHVGEQGWINPFAFLGNGLEQSFTCSSAGGFGNLSQTYTFINYVNTGIWYPQPPNTFTGMGKFDPLGNLIYGEGANVDKYWKNYAVANSTPVVCSGWREGSRISFQFTDIQINWNSIPYQNQRITVPSGQCTISGAFGYVAQADASVVTEGIIMQNNTVYPNSGYNYSPYYVSDVLNRIPTLGLPSGTIFSPVLEAPSVMEQRVIVPVIQQGQQYNYLDTAAPQNYNKFLWPALSDLESLNPGETIEVLPPDDGSTYLNSSAMFSASQGQLLPNGLKNPNIQTVYDVIAAYQLYDSIATDSIINSGYAMTTSRGTTVRLTSDMLSGAICPINTTLTVVQAGLT